MEARRVIVAVPFGPLTGRRAVLSPGESVRVGRSGLADLVVPHDDRMSSLHVEIAWDGAACRFRDLRSASGTEVNGEEGRAAGELRNGDWLKAGDTVLTVHVEGSTPPPDPLDDADDEDDDALAAALEAERAARLAREAAAEKALAELEEEAARAPLFAILDAARDKRIRVLLRESVDEHRSLYEGVEGETMAHVAPYLVRLPAGSRLLASLAREGWGKRWGVYFTTTHSFKETRRHLRRFLIVQVEDTGEPMYFRFYDPRVLREFWPVATTQQTDDLCSVDGGFLVEGEGLEVIRLTSHAEARRHG